MYKGLLDLLARKAHKVYLVPRVLSGLGLQALKAFKAYKEPQVQALKAFRVYLDSQALLQQ